MNIIKNLCVKYSNIVVFSLFTILYSLYNFYEAGKIGFESSIFAPFRYEGLLFFKNAVMSDSEALFFIRDWSTSFIKDEHPLLYFHNFDFVHFLAGFVQYFFSNSKIILFLISLAVSVIGLWITWGISRKMFGGVLAFIFFLAVLLPGKAFLLSPQNLFVSISLLCLVWNFRLLRRIWDNKEINTLFFIELFGCFLLSALAETNQTILMAIITGFFVLYSFKWQERFKYLSILAVVAAPVVFLRVLQVIFVKMYGFWDLYMLDVNYTGRIKVNSSIDLPSAIEFYSKQGLVFFGQGEPQKIIHNLHSTLSYYLDNFGGFIWVAVICASIFLLFIGRTSKIPASLENIGFKTSRNEFFKNNFFIIYIVIFTLLLYIIPAIEQSFCYSIIFLAILVPLAHKFILRLMAALSDRTLPVQTSRLNLFFDFPGKHQQLVFIAAYVCFFTIASFMMVFLSGNVVIAKSLSNFGTLDFTVLYSACFIVLVPCFIYYCMDIYNPEKPWRLVLFAVLACFFCISAYDSMFKIKEEHFSYKEALSKVEKNSEIISNYEPSILSVETGSRVSMSWYDKAPSSCKLAGSDRVLKMYRAGENYKPAQNTYIFLALFQPYLSIEDFSVEKTLNKRFCIDKLPLELLFRDKFYVLYRVRD